MIDNFAVFITSHNSPNECKSLDSLRLAGYKGKVYIVIDDLDPAKDKYHYDDLLVFDKEKYVRSLDTGLPSKSPQYSAVLYARAAVEDFAKQMHLNYFCVLDDDIVGFRFRYIDKMCKLRASQVSDMESVFSAYTEYMQDCSIACLSFANDGSFIAGADAVLSGTMLERRTCHTIFIRKVSIPIDWSFAINEDYITSIREGNSGKLFFTLPFVQRTITGMNDRANGMHDVYATTSDFQRSFYSVIACPWTCTPKMYKGKYVNGMCKDTAFPKIVSSRYRKIAN